MDDSITNDQKSIILDKMGEVSFRLLSGGSEYLQLMNFGTTALMAFQKK
jgi:hypothetical protein